MTVGAAGVEAIRHGRSLDQRLVGAGFPVAPPPARMRVLDEAGSLIALAVPQGFDPPATGADHRARAAPGHRPGRLMFVPERIFLTNPRPAGAAPFRNGRN